MCLYSWHSYSSPIDPANVSNIWTVDSGTDKVYQYTAATARTSGSQTAAATFALAAGNRSHVHPPKRLFLTAIPDQPTRFGVYRPTRPDSRSLAKVQPLTVWSRAVTAAEQSSFGFRDELREIQRLRH